MLIGATPEGRKELVGFIRSRPRERAGLTQSAARPEAARARRAAAAHHRRCALGFWKTAGEVWPKTREQRCWGTNVLAKFPKSQRPKAKRGLQEIWMAETKAAAELAFDAFIESYTPKYEKAADYLSADLDTLVAFAHTNLTHSVPAPHFCAGRKVQFRFRHRVTVTATSQPIASVV
ncbi:transposase-like protein [Bradyrhizobium diazoefficiens]|uniref:Mutator family transposase n=1 Tax=Bradyrhizobium diazoefficiens SEMIA 5080 TaxID=754504 RepID=A0A837CCV9_9BRAD|nr:putative tranposase [Bradyrhizobium diazoefficiens SEMIA 5080]